MPEAVFLFEKKLASPGIIFKLSQRCDYRRIVRLQSDPCGSFLFTKNQQQENEEETK